MAPVILAVYTLCDSKEAIYTSLYMYALTSSWCTQTMQCIGMHHACRAMHCRVGKKHWGYSDSKISIPWYPGELFTSCHVSTLARKTWKSETFSLHSRHAAHFPINQFCHIGRVVADFGALFHAKSCDYQTNQNHCWAKYTTSPPSPYDFYCSFERITGPNFNCHGEKSRIPRSAEIWHPCMKRKIWWKWSS
jgi:hypothetical protein